MEFGHDGKIGRVRSYHLDPGPFDETVAATKFHGEFRADRLERMGRAVFEIGHLIRVKEGS